MWIMTFLYSLGYNLGFNFLLEVFVMLGSGMPCKTYNTILVFYIVHYYLPF